VRRRTKQGLALLGGAVIITLAWPGPSGADTSLGGYSGTALADPIHIQIYEPALPLPSSPQIDIGIGYAKAHTDTGPVSRATASYLWPGDVIGDGFNQLVKANPNAKYPVQVNSRYPATSDSPAQNTAQLTQGNGMTTSSNGFVTTASVTGLGVAGPNTDLLSGIGQGLGQLLGKNKPTKQLPPLPVPVSSTLGGLITLQNMHSDSTVDVETKTITSTAHASMTAIKLLAGLITVDGLDVTSQTVSDGSKATATGSVTALQVSIAGQKLGFTDKGVEVAGSTTALPSIPSTVTSLLGQVGIGVSYAPAQRTVQGATGSYQTSGLSISIDTAPLKKALNVGGIVAPLQKLVERIPKLGDNLGPLLGIGPKIVFTLGDVQTNSTAAPAYTGGIGAGGTVGGGSSAGSPGGTLPGGTLNPGTTSGTTPGTPGTIAPVNGSVAPTALNLPGLGKVPRALVLGSLLAAALVGWGMKVAGGFLLAGGRSCAHGLATGVPDLRKG